MSVDFDSLTNRGEYLSAHYFADQLAVDLRKGILGLWTTRETDEHDKRPTPRKLVRELRGTYLSETCREYFADLVDKDADDERDDVRLHTYGNPDWVKRLASWHQDVLTALGYLDPPAEPDDADGPADGIDQQVEPTAPEPPVELAVHRAGRDHIVHTAWHGDGIVALDCGWTAVNDGALDADGAGRLLYPLRVNASESYETGAALVTWLFQSELGGPGGEPPRFVLLLCGGVIVLADRNSWGEGRYLAANLDAALERNDRKQTGELATISALFSREMLLPAEGNAGALWIDDLLKKSTDNAVGVSGELREGLQRSVEVIANEVLARLTQAEVEPSEVEDTAIPFARELTRESLRYLYRILFLLYAEARPELGILPADDGSYEAGYSVARLRELVARDEQLVEEEAKQGFHLFESLDVLCRQINDGHRPYGTEPDDPQADDDEETAAAKARRRSEDRGLRFEPLRSELFEPKAIRLIGRTLSHPRVDDRRLDLRLRNEALHEVLRLLTMKKGARNGERGGFISYRNLGINQLGAVYEGLMSYTGIIAEEELCEVAKGGDPEKGSWLIPARRQTDYPEKTLVMYDEHDMRKGLRGPKRYQPGTFVYRLAGRDRETSASYYTPESLTKVTVELTLKHRLDQEKDADNNEIRTRAAELLKYRICEPALGSGAFLNEAINQVAEEYLRRRQDELGKSVPTADALTEKQKVKAYIALHNAYGVDLNATGVELAEVSLWLNTMHPGMRAPWFGLHLRRGNSLVGARRAVFSGEDVTSAEKAWLKTKGALAPTPLPFLKDGAEQPLPANAVHQFLLPSPGWAVVAGAKEARALAKEDADRLAKWKRGVLQRPKHTPADLNPDAKRKPTKHSQFARLRDAARRVEFLWALVVKRMQISEDAIARKIDVWGSDPDDPEFGFLRRPEHAVTKEQVFEDLFNAPDTPYWRLKMVMDAWCALWFWPVDKAGLLDGTDPVYTATANIDFEALLDETVPMAPPAPAPEPEPIPEPISRSAEPIIQHQGVFFRLDGERLMLDDDDDELVEEQVISRPEPKKPKAKPEPGRRVIPLANLDDWLDFVDAMLGTKDVDGTVLSGLDTLPKLKDYETVLPSFMVMDEGDPEQRFPWLHEVRNIASQQGFLHWELEFALVFAQGGGFDLQVGNPPWVRPDWKEDAVLAEYEPWFGLTEKPGAAEKARRRAAELERPEVSDYLRTELKSTIAMAKYLANAQVYPMISGGRPDFYRAFMCQAWSHAVIGGCIGLVHPDTHFAGDKEARLREESYRRLRLHADFVNAGNRFFPPPVGRSSHFGVHIYSDVREVNFKHLSWLFSVESLRLSEGFDADDDPPGVKFDGKWDDRPHPLRVIQVDVGTLARWRRMMGDDDIPVATTPLLTPVSRAEDPAIDALGSYPVRLRRHRSQITQGLNETISKKSRFGSDGASPLIDYNTNVDNRVDYEAGSWREVILVGPQIGVANPLFKQPSQGGGEVLGLDHRGLAIDAVPESEYRQMVDDSTYLGEQDKWVDRELLDKLRGSEEAIDDARARLAAIVAVDPHEVANEAVDSYLTARATKPYTQFYRVAWREMIAPDTERSLYVALIPPGPTHVHAVRSSALCSKLDTALLAGFWASLPLDYLLRTTGVGHLDVAQAQRLPAPQRDHPLAGALLLRTLRLNCLTSAYADLWNELYPATDQEGWAYGWRGLTPLTPVSPKWEYDTPLRTERARRSALVEIDALVAVWLGISADTLVTMYRARFPIMQDFDRVTWFDANERKIAGDRYTYGHGQTKEHWKQFEEYLARGKKPPMPEGYVEPFEPADRETEMQKAHAVFQARLDAAVARGEWDPVKQEVLQS
ncbi:class I SAM-dependent DNA methyltransferase [Actinosynnema sp. NPDC050801]|uniref:class I SAM-dependent DNA methyltransferase n=1 Tax=unclassified Actinosynnema TaxID=2637065 RepID=UPI0033EC7966